MVSLSRLERSIECCFKIFRCDANIFGCISIQCRIFYVDDNVHKVEPFRLCRMVIQGVLRVFTSESTFVDFHVRIISDMLERNETSELRDIHFCSVGVFPASYWFFVLLGSEAARIPESLPQYTSIHFSISNYRSSFPLLFIAGWMMVRSRSAIFNSGHFWRCANALFAPLIRYPVYISTCIEMGIFRLGSLEASGRCLWLTSSAAYFFRSLQDDVSYHHPGEEKWTFLFPRISSLVS